MKKIVSAVALIGALSLTGCSSNPASTDQVTSDENRDGITTSTPSQLPEPSDDAMDETTGDASKLVIGDSFFFVSSSNAIGKFELPSKADAEIESFRKAAKADEVTYALVQIDNREGAAYANMYALNVYGDDGAKYEFRSIDEFIDGWQEGVERTPENNQLNSDMVDAINHHMEGVDAGMVGEILMATEGELPDQFEQITAEVHGAGDPVFAASIADGQGLDLEFEVPKKNKK